MLGNLEPGRHDAQARSKAEVYTTGYNAGLKAGFEAGRQAGRLAERQERGDELSLMRQGLAESGQIEHDEEIQRGE